MTVTMPHRRAMAWYGASTEREAPPALSTGEAGLREAYMLRRRAADGVRNDPLIANAVGILRRGTIANPYPVSSDRDAQQAFEAWAKSCGYRHSHGTFAQVQRMIAHHLIQDGECFVQRVWTTSARSTNGMLLAVWPKRLVDTSHGHNTTGHEYEDGMWSGTWFQGDSIEPGYQGFQPVFVPARDLLWVRHVYEGDHVEGLPRGAASIESAKQLADYAVTSLMQHRVSACLAAMVIAEGSPWAIDFDAGPTITDMDGNEMVDLQPGSIPIVTGAKDVKTVTPTTAGSFDVHAHTSRVAAGYGITAEQISGDLSRTNYSSARHGFLVKEEVLEDIDMDFDPAREGILEWWREAEAMAGRDWSGAVFEWLERPQAAIDPVKTAQADQIEIALGIKTRRQAIAERGRDPEQVLEEWRQEREEFGDVAAQAAEGDAAEDDQDDSDRAQQGREPVRAALPARGGR